MLKSERLILTGFIESQRQKVSVAAVLIEYEAAGFIASVIEEDHSRRSAVRPRHDFPVDDSCMLAFPIGNDHSQLAVLFHDVDALNIDFFKLLPPVFLITECRKQKSRRYERGYCRVYLQ